MMQCVIDFDKNPVYGRRSSLVKSREWMASAAFGFEAVSDDERGFVGAEGNS